MSDAIRAEAAKALAAVEEVTAVVLPEPGKEVVALPEAPAPVAAEIRKRMAELDMTDTGSIVNFGSAAQAEPWTLEEAVRALSRRLYRQLDEQTKKSISDGL